MNDRKVLMIKGCSMCWYKCFGKCFYDKMGEEVCPSKGFLKNCPLQTQEEMYEAMKTYKYYEETDW